MENVLKGNMRSWLKINLNRISHNVREVQKLISSTGKIMAIIKTNGYRYGNVKCSRMMEQQGIDFSGVNNVGEGVRLHENGIQDPILMLRYTPSVHFHYLNEASLVQTLVSEEYAKKLNAYAREQNIVVRVHTEANIGMPRVGIVAQDHAYRIKNVRALYCLEYLDVCSIFSHFSVSSCLGEENHVSTNRQIASFEYVLVDLHAEGIDSGITHLQNNYGILNYPSLHYDYVHPGLLWTGIISDDALATRTAPRFQPITEWKANVPLVKSIQPDITISYDRHFKMEAYTKVAALVVGYADDFPRSVSNQGVCVLLHGRCIPIIGNIYMDQMTVDIAGFGGVSEDNIATLVGRDGDEVLSVDGLSRSTHTINNETFCRISQRVLRMYKQSQQM